MMNGVLCMFLLLSVRSALSNIAQKVVELEESKSGLKDTLTGIDEIEQIYLEEEKNRLVAVFVQDDEISAPMNAVAVLPCEYFLCPKSEIKVKVTWKVGVDPTTAKRVVTCEGYDPANGGCDQMRIDDPGFEGRVGMVQSDSPSLTIFQVAASDNHNFWCQVQTGDNRELGSDMKSVVLRVRDSPDERPKFNHVSLQQNLIKASVGETVTLDCSCTGYHCEDVSWYKGPTNEWGSSFTNLYTKRTHFRDDPEIIVNEMWKDRISVDGYRLTLTGLRETDAGRYWCEAKGSGYYALGETGTDAKSLVLVVTDEPEFTYNCN